MVGCLVVPRPDDVVKWAILPAGFVVGAVTAGPPGVTAVGRALLVWAALELLVYPARYQVNDMLGFEADQRHPDGDRGRLPGPLGRKRSRILSSAAVVLLKLVTQPWSPCWRPPRWADPDRGHAAVLATAVVYEPLRTLATGHTGQVPALGVGPAPLTALTWAAATLAQVIYLRQCSEFLGATSRLMKAALLPSTKREAGWTSRR